jgi:cytochrome c biogenesis protein CcdA
MVVALTLAGMLIGGGLARVHLFSVRLPTVLRPFLPPLLIVAGILQTGLFFASRDALAGIGREPRGKTCLISSLRLFALGMVLALSFCPATAGLFFGLLIPLATTHGNPALYAFAYGLGYGLPVVAVSVCLGNGMRLAALRRYGSAVSLLSGWGLIALGTWLTWRLL